MLLFEKLGIDSKKITPPYNISQLQQQIKKAYYVLALKYHPDKNKEASANGIMQELNLLNGFLTENLEYYCNNYVSFDQLVEKEGISSLLNGDWKVKINTARVYEEIHLESAKEFVQSIKYQSLTDFLKQLNLAIKLCQKNLERSQESPFHLALHQLCEKKKILVGNLQQFVNTQFNEVNEASISETLKVLNNKDRPDIFPLDLISTEEKDDFDSISELYKMALDDKLAEKNTLSLDANKKFMQLRLSFLKNSDYHYSNLSKMINELEDEKEKLQQLGQMDKELAGMLAKEIDFLKECQHAFKDYENKLIQNLKDEDYEASIKLLDEEFETIKKIPADLFSNDINNRLSPYFKNLLHTYKQDYQRTLIEAKKYCFSFSEQGLNAIEEILNNPEKITLPNNNITSDNNKILLLTNIYKSYLLGYLEEIKSRQALNKQKETIITKEKKVVLGSEKDTQKKPVIKIISQPDSVSKESAPEGSNVSLNYQKQTDESILPGDSSNLNKNALFEINKQEINKQEIIQSISQKLKDTINQRASFSIPLVMRSGKTELLDLFIQWIEQNKRFKSAERDLFAIQLLHDICAIKRNRLGLFTPHSVGELKALTKHFMMTMPVEKVFCRRVLMNLNKVEDIETLFIHPQINKPKLTLN